MERATDPTIVRQLRGADRLLEVGIGDRTGVAAGLVAAGADVRATDVIEPSVPAGVRFRVEDVTTVDDPDKFYRVDVIYALNCPPDLHRPIRDLAEQVGAEFRFTTLGFDEPSIPVRRETVTEGDKRVVLYTAELRRDGDPQR
jgi:uncharacterized UPF0146 family protein